MKDTLLYIGTGAMLFIFLPVGIIMLAYIMLKIIHGYIYPTDEMVEDSIEKYTGFKKHDLSDEEVEKAR